MRRPEEVVVYTPKQWKERERDSLKKMLVFMAAFVIVIIIFAIFIYPTRPSQQVQSEEKRVINEENDELGYKTFCINYICNQLVKSDIPTIGLHNYEGYKMVEETKRNFLVCTCGINEVWANLDRVTEEMNDPHSSPSSVSISSLLR